MCKQSLVEGLKSLEDSGFIVRRHLGRKHVEYQPNTKVLAIRDLLQEARNWAKTIDERRRSLERLTGQWSDWLAKSRHHKQMRNQLVRALIHSYCYLIAYEATQISRIWLVTELKLENIPLSNPYTNRGFAP